MSIKRNERPCYSLRPVLNMAHECHGFHMRPLSDLGSQFEVFKLQQCS